MFFFENGVVEFIWPWSSLFMPLPILVRLITPYNRSFQALPVPFFNRIEALTQKSFFLEKNITSLVVFGFAWILIVLASMRPQWVGDPVEIPLSGRSVMLAVDLSGSMKEKDLELEGVAMSRLEIVKTVMGPFIERRKGDRIGLILFGDQAYLQTPLTFDRKTLLQMLKESELGLAGEKTAIGNAIGLAVKRMRELPDREKVMILLTDGQNTAGDVSPRDAGRMANDTGLKIHTIGVGADEAWVRTFFGKQKINPSAELDEEMLKDLSKTTGGNYFRARNTEELEKIYALIDEIEPVEKAKEVYRPRYPLFIWPLSLAVLIIALWLFIFIIRSYSIK